MASSDKGRSTNISFWSSIFDNTTSVVNDSVSGFAEYASNLRERLEARDRERQELLQEVGIEIEGGENIESEGNGEETPQEITVKNTPAPSNMRPMHNSTAIEQDTPQRRRPRDYETSPSICLLYTSPSPRDS